MAHNHISRFEDRLQRLIEGGFARLFAERLHPREVAIRLARAMEDGVREHETQRAAPDIYIVRLNPKDHSAILAAQPDLVGRLAQELVEIARAAKLTLVRMPQVRLIADQQIAPHEISISAAYADQKPDSTQVMHPNGSLPDASAADPPRGAMLMDGERHVPLQQSVINLGRGRQNDIIIEDARVSRRHAQIRLRFGAYVLFDLGSTGGTTVNNEAIQEAVLRAGDVIGLAGHNLIYVEDPHADAPEEDALSGTRPYPTSGR